MPPEGPPRRPAPPPPWSHGPREPTLARPPKKPTVPPETIVDPVPGFATPEPAPEPVPAPLPVQTTAPGPVPAPVLRAPAPAKPEPAPAVATVVTPPPKLAPPPAAPNRTAPMGSLSSSPVPVASPSSNALPLLAPPEAPPAAPPPDPTGATVVARRAQLAFVRASARAFRSRISPADILPDERAALTLVTPPIIDPNVHAFYAWRRSIVFLLAATLSVLGVLRIVELARAHDNDSALALRILVLALELAVAATTWIQLTRWTAWERQRRILSYAALGFVAAPFLAYLYPVRTFYGDASSPEVGFAAAMQLLVLVIPRVLALAPGLARGLRLTGATRHLPYVAGAGAVAAYLALAVPYQVTGSGWLVAAILAFVAGELLVLKKDPRPRIGALAAGAIFAAIAFDAPLATAGAALAYGCTYLFAALIAADATRPA